MTLAGHPQDEVCIMKRIAILNCTNTTQDMGCSACMCLDNINKTAGGFARYKGDGGAQLVGIINCAGCPTSVAPEKLLNRVRSLTCLGVDAIHLSSCIMAVCPFKNKYLDVLRREFPGIEFVEGTHGTSAEEGEMFRHLANHMLTAPKPNLPELSLKAAAQATVKK
jgi:predicted metal-binding protein